MSKKSSGVKDILVILVEPSRSLPRCSCEGQVTLKSEQCKQMPKHRERDFGAGFAIKMRFGFRGNSDHQSPRSLRIPTVDHSYSAHRQRSWSSVSLSFSLWSSSLHQDSIKYVSLHLLIFFFFKFVFHAFLV